MAKRAGSHTSTTALTARQREVLAMIAAGRTNPEIADALGISLDGAKFHVREIFARLGVDSREEAADLWRTGGGGGGASWLTRALTVGSLKLAGVVAIVAAIAVGGRLLLAWANGDDEQIECPPGSFAWKARAIAGSAGTPVDIRVVPTVNGIPCTHATLVIRPGDDIAAVARIASEIKGYDVHYPSELPAWREASYTVSEGSARFDLALADGQVASFGVSQGRYGPLNPYKTRAAVHPNGQRIWRLGDGGLELDSPTWGTRADHPLSEAAAIAFLQGLRPALPDTSDYPRVAPCALDAGTLLVEVTPPGSAASFRVSARSSSGLPCALPARIEVAAWLTWQDGSLEHFVQTNGLQTLTLALGGDTHDDFRELITGELKNACGTYESATVSVATRSEAPEENRVFRYVLPVPSCEDASRPPSMSASPVELLSSHVPFPNGEAVSGVPRPSLCPGTTCAAADAFFHYADPASFVHDPVTRDYQCNILQIATEAMCAGAKDGDMRPGVPAIEQGQHRRLSAGELQGRISGAIGFAGDAPIIAIGEFGDGAIDVVIERTDGEIVSVAFVPINGEWSPAGYREWPTRPTHGERAESSLGFATYYDWH